ncbi:MAG: protein kinase, partial [Dehalococcoidia bacterium]
MPPERIGGYEVLRELGSGGQATVYLCRDPSSGNEVAVKVLRLGPGSDADQLERFRREALTASAVRHPNVVEIVEVGEADGTHYIAMEYLPGD